MNTLLCRTESICLRLNGIKTRKSFINSSWCQVRNSSSEKKDDSNVNDLFNLQNTSKVSTTDKWIIYKFGTKGKYKSYKDVPDRVNNSIFDRARARFRIRMNIAGILLTVTLAMFYIKSGKGRVKDGENLSNISMNRIASYKNEKKSD